jgi:hypothetical protein
MPPLASRLVLNCGDTRAFPGGEAFFSLADDPAALCISSTENVVEPLHIFWEIA